MRVSRPGRRFQHRGEAVQHRVYRDAVLVVHADDGERAGGGSGRDGDGARLDRSRLCDSRRGHRYIHHRL